MTRGASADYADYPERNDETKTRNQMLETRTTVLQLVGFRMEARRPNPSVYFARYNSRVVPSVTELNVECCAGGSLTKRGCE